MQYLTDSFQNILNFFRIELFSIGNSSITIFSLIYLFLGTFLLLYFSSKIKKLLTKKVSKRYKIQEGHIESIATIIRYVVVSLGLIIIIQSAGIDLSALSILAGALGVGIGFGLQSITNNFISGLIILFEQPIKVGDRVTVGVVEGDVMKIAARATTILTNDNITLIIPNSEFVSTTVTNWSHNDRNVSLRFQVGVSYKSDPEHVRDILLEVAKNDPGILSNPSPDVLFDDFGDSALIFKLRIWTSDYINRPLILKSRLLFAIFKKFKQEGIEIPFPQRDVHIINKNNPSVD
ncbi:MAG: mechanosensitive ion channel [Cyclobacteriaceae bacterium]|nr:mechanosensitive ion channel [Cyclobacteriaceae bacterium]